MSEASRNRQEEREDTDIRISRSLVRKVAFGVALLTAGVSGGGVYYSWENTGLFDSWRTPTFEQARKRPERRQAFLDYVKKDMHLEYISSVIYDPSGQQIQKHTERLRDKYGKPEQEVTVNVPRNTI